MKKSRHENFMHQNEIFAPGMIFSPQKLSWVIRMYTHSYMEFFTQEEFLHEN